MNNKKLSPELLASVTLYIQGHYKPDYFADKGGKKETGDYDMPGSRLELKDGQPVLSESDSREKIQDAVRQVGENFHQMLFRLISERNLSEAEVYRRAQVDRRLFSKIRRQNDYTPRKGTVLALALALHLNLEETKDLLSRAEQALSPGRKSDIIVEFCIRNQIYDLFEVNAILCEFGEKALP